MIQGELDFDDPVETVRCYECGVEKTLDKFSKDKSRPNGHDNKCKKCCTLREQTVSNKHSRYRQGAKRRGYEFTLEPQDTSGLLLGDCYYCGAKCPGEKVKLHGMDRIDNDRGYHIDNVVPCCGQCNIAKHTFTQEEFIDMCKRVAQRHTTYKEVNSKPLLNTFSRWLKVYLKDSEVGEISEENFEDPIW